MVVKRKRRSTRYRDLTVGQRYVVIGIQADANLRLLNNAGSPLSYPLFCSLFVLTDAREPLDWVTEVGDDGERYAYPPPFNTPGFFEDFFDRKDKGSDNVLARRESSARCRKRSRVGHVAQHALHQTAAGIVSGRW